MFREIIAFYFLIFLGPSSGLTAASTQKPVAFLPVSHLVYSSVEGVKSSDGETISDMNENIEADFSSRLSLELGTWEETSDVSLRDILDLYDCIHAPDENSTATARPKLSEKSILVPPAEQGPRLVVWVQGLENEKYTVWPPVWKWFVIVPVVVLLVFAEGIVQDHGGGQTGAYTAADRPWCSVLWAIILPDGTVSSWGRRNGSYGGAFNIGDLRLRQDFVEKVVADIRTAVKKS
jgi:hypothetical protein